MSRIQGGGHVWERGEGRGGEQEVLRMWNLVPDTASLTRQKSSVWEVKGAA